MLLASSIGGCGGIIIWSFCLFLFSHVGVRGFPAPKASLDAHHATLADLRVLGLGFRVSGLGFSFLK